MERGVKHRPRRRSPLPFLLLAVAVVGCAFAVAVAAVVPMEADSPGGQDQALPTPTLEEAERDKLAAEIERVNADNRALRRKIERLERELQKARAGE